MTDITEVMQEVQSGIEEFKATNKTRVDELTRTVERMETRLSRPGAFATGTSDDGSEIRSLKTVDGKSIPMLKSSQRISDLNRADDSEGFNLGSFVRDAIVGSRKSSSGPALVPTFVANNIIDSVRKRTVLVEAGASTIFIDGPTNMARLTQDPTVYQHTEATVDIVESDILAAPVTLNPKLLAVLVPLTVEVVQDSANLDAVLRAALEGAFAAKLDALGIATLLADVSIAKSLATQDPAIWAKVLAAVGDALNLNMDIPSAHISAPADFIARASQLASTAGTWLGKPPALASMRELQTSGLSAGTALMGDFTRAVAMAIRSQLTVEVVRHAKPTSASHLLVAHMRADCVVLQPGHLFKQLKTI